MPRVKFHATSDREEWTHKPGRMEEVEYEDEDGGSYTTTKPKPPIVMRDGDVEEFTPFEAHWATTQYPDNFSILDDAEVDIADDDFEVRGLTYRQLQSAAGQLTDAGIEVRGTGPEEELRERVEDAYETFLTEALDAESES